MSAPGKSRPRRFDVNLAVIGAGAAGLVTAYTAAAARARVVLVERERMGGDCLNTGCVPSKALLRAARLAHDIRRAGDFGLVAGDPAVDFPRVMARVREVVRRVAPHDSVERYTALGVDCRQGHARFTSPWTIDIDGTALTARSIVIATGGRPAMPPIPGLDQVGALTSDTVWQLEALPRRLLVLGGGPIGCELAQAFARLGSQVTLVEQLPRLLNREEPDAGALVAGQFAREGIRVLTGTRVLRLARSGDECRAECDHDGRTETVTADTLLVATGRRANTAGLDLAAAGLTTRDNGTVAVNDYLQTRHAHILACGDVAGPFQLTHAGGYQGWFCAMNGLFGDFKRFRPDYTAMPWAIFTDPEVARVGLTTAEAQDRGLEVTETRYGLEELDRAIAEGDNRGFVSVLTHRDSDRLLGATVVGPQAGEILAEFVLALRHGLGLRKILNTVHIYPTLAEANRYAAGQWQQAHLPRALLGLAARFHRWRRG